MGVLRVCLIGLLLVFSGAVLAQEHARIQDQLIVQLQPGADVQDISVYQVKKPKLLSEELNIWLLYIDTSKNASEDILYRLREQPEVKIAQYNHFIQQRSRTPNDTLFPQQWNLKNVGQEGFFGIDVSAPEAWDYTVGGGVTKLGDSIVIAVVDGGFDLNHPDLNYFRNRDEIPMNGIDDDENGFVDDHVGWSAYDSSGFMPLDYHGTHVAGIAGAKGNNTIGVAGINWNVKILPVAGLSEDEAEVVTAYSYVYAMRKLYNTSGGKKGAFIVVANSSFGVNYGQAKDFPIWCAMYDSLGKQGVLSVVATANISINVDSLGDIPTSCSSPYMIAVTNSTSEDKKFRYAAFGPQTVDIAAPGTNILSTIPFERYAKMSGTSMAAPHVSGAVALMYSFPRDALAQDAIYSPSSTALYMKKVLLENADKPEAFLGMTTYGRLNLYKAVKALGTDDCRRWNRPVTLLRIFPNPAKEMLHLNVYNEETGFATLQIFNNLGQPVKTLQYNFNNRFIERQLDVNIADMRPGLYYIALSWSNGRRSNIMPLMVR